MKAIFLLISSIAPLLSWAQLEDSNALELKIDTSLYIMDLHYDSNYVVSIEKPECPYTVEKALQAIQKGSIRLVINNGFIGRTNMDDNRTSEFQIKYNVEFDYVGCMIYWDEKDEDIEGFNLKMFEYLTQLYGEKVHLEYKNIWN